MSDPILTNQEKRKLKAEAQHLDPIVRVGKNGLTAAVLHCILQALDSRALIKIRFEHEREERDLLANEVAQKTKATLLMQVGKVAVFYRPKPAAPAETSPSDD
jgi:RNA-binding protein